MEYTYDTLQSAMCALRHVQAYSALKIFKIVTAIEHCWTGAQFTCHHCHCTAPADIADLGRGRYALPFRFLSIDISSFNSDSALDAYVRLACGAGGSRVKEGVNARQITQTLEKCHISQSQERQWPRLC